MSAAKTRCFTGQGREPKNSSVRLIIFTCLARDGNSQHQAFDGSRPFLCYRLVVHVTLGAINLKGPRSPLPCPAGAHRHFPFLQRVGVNAEVSRPISECMATQCVTARHIDEAHHRPVIRVWLGDQALDVQFGPCEAQGIASPFGGISPKFAMQQCFGACPTRLQSQAHLAVETQVGGLVVYSRKQSSDDR